MGADACGFASRLRAALPTVLLLLSLPGCEAGDDGSDPRCRELRLEHRERALEGDAEAVREEQLALEEPSIPHDPVFVGDEGTDAFGYPLRQPDERALLRLLRLRRFDDLDRWMAHFQAEFAADQRKEHWPDAALSAFFDPDPALTPLLDEWVQAHPESYAAWAARGNHRHARGQQARGGAAAAETSVGQGLGLAAELLPATEDISRALELNPDFIPAYTRLISMLGWANGVEFHVTARELLDAATGRCPGCYAVRSEYISHLSPKWGGTRVAMEAHINGLRPRFERYPRLRMLLGHADHDRCTAYLEKERYEQALVTCDATLRHGEDPSYLESKAKALMLLDRAPEAVPLLDRALELSPQHRGLLLTRSLVLTKLDLRGTARDLSLLVELGFPRDLHGLVESTAAHLVERGRAHSERREHELAATYFDAAAKLLPDDAAIRDLQARNDARIDPDALLARAKASPDDLQLHIRADYALASAHRLEPVLELWDGFIAHHPLVARAYLERSGTHALLRHPEASLADLEKACELGSALGCLRLEQHRAGCDRRAAPEDAAPTERSLVLAATAVGLLVLLLLMRRRSGGRLR
jgi:tetratricopeptide (TPR) repeat protein